MSPSKSAEDIIEQVGELVKGVWSHKESPEALSKDLNDIAVLNWAMSQWRVEFEESERAMKSELELEKAKIIDEFISTGGAVNKAEIKATIALSKMRQEYNKIASSLERVKITAGANEKVMDAARSRLSLIKGETK